jgi:hypothetical protein
MLSYLQCMTSFVDDPKVVYVFISLSSYERSYRNKIFILHHCNIYILANVSDISLTVILKNNSCALN